MKKLNYLLLGAAGFLLASCSQEEIVGPAASGDGNFHVTVNLPKEFQTRAIGDGMTAQVLTYAVYDASTNVKVSDGSTKFGASLTTTVDFNLANGKEYNIAFFAQSEASKPIEGQANSGVYDFDVETGTMTVNYANMTSENNINDCYDCFYKTISTGVVGSASSSVTALLTRPMAQINWGVDKTELSEKVLSTEFGENGEYISSVLTCTPYSTLNLLTGAVSNNQNEVKLGTFLAPYLNPYPNVSGDGEAAQPVASNPYVYAALQYVLAPSATPAVYDLTLTINNSTNSAVSTLSYDVAVSNVSVQANYQTNIYGYLLSSNVQVTVTKVPGFAGSYPYEYGVQKPAEGTNPNEYVITSQAELNWIAEQLNSGSAPNNFSSYTFTIQNDIYMSGTFTPIGIAGKVATMFSGTIDGGGNTIYNMVVDQEEGAGFVGFLTGVVKNLNFENATVSGNHWAGVVAAYTNNNTNNPAQNIVNCKVSNSTVTLTCEQVGNKWDNGDKAGVIVGYLGPNDTVTGCEVTDCTVSAYRDMGSIAGIAYAGCTITNNEVNGVNIYINNSRNPENIQDQAGHNAGEIVGRQEGTLSLDTNTANNVSIIMVGGSSDDDQITSLDQLKYIISILPSTGYIGDQTITFAPNTEIDLEGVQLEPIVMFVQAYSLIIDFNNSTLKNVNLTNDCPALFSKVVGSIKNLKVDGLTANVTTTTNNELVGLIGALESGSAENITITNVSINCPNISQVGPVVAYTADNSWLSGCSVSGGSITGNLSVGGLVGTSTGNFTNCSASDLTIISNSNPGTPWGGDLAVQAGALSGGIISSNTVFTGCSISDVTINGTSSDLATLVSYYSYTYNGSEVAANYPAN